MAGAVRQPIDEDALHTFLQKHVPEIDLPVEVRQFGSGQSNPTYQLKDSLGVKFVLRKKPPGRLLSRTAHKVEREYRIIHALRNSDVPVPKAYCLCQDDKILGTPFYIMSFVEGRIIEDASIPGVSPEERQAMWHDAIRTLAKLHTVIPKEVGLAEYGKAFGYYNRQISTFETISKSQAETQDVESGELVGQIPHFDQMMEFFGDQASAPADRMSLVHGDYKIDNLVFHPSEPRVIGILDWEMSTLGHPLADLSNLLQPFILSRSPELRAIRPQIAKFWHSSVPGLPSREKCIAWYAEDSGWDPTAEVAWGAAFDATRACLIIQGISARQARRQASSARAHEYIKQFNPIGEFAWSLVKQLQQNPTSKL